VPKLVLIIDDGSILQFGQSLLPKGWDGQQYCEEKKEFHTSFALQNEGLRGSIPDSERLA
jgi:hypothetical protein